MYSIEVDKVTKIYRKGLRGVKITAVTDLSFTVRKGFITGFVGPNGAGKTTVIKMLLNLTHPTCGTLRLNGIDASFPAARKGVAFLPEQPFFYSHLTVEEMLKFAADLTGIPASGALSEISRVLEAVELTHKRRARIKELSKGLQQRLNMAQALLGNPHTLLLDEPMSGMDPPGRRLFRELMAALRREGRTLFFSTHVLDDVEAICDDVVVLEGGKLNYAGEVRALLEEGFLGMEISVSADKKGTVESLKESGVETRYDADSRELKIFVPKAGDTAAVLRQLHDHGVFPISISRRTMTLESLLYSRKKGEPS